MTGSADFIDRTKLEALAGKRYSAIFVATFMEGVDSALALLDDETTEEWSHYKSARSGLQVRYPGRKEGNVKPEHMDEWTEESRRVTPWLPSEGGEKP